MEAQEVQPGIAPSMKFDGFNPYFHCRLQYDERDKTKVIGRWMNGEFTPVNFGHQNKTA
jgi:hypothetical protein